MDNLEEMEKFLEMNNLPRLEQEEIEDVKRPITSNDMGSVLGQLSADKASRPDGFIGEFYQTFSEVVAPVFSQTIPKIAEEIVLPNSFCEASISLIPKQDKDTTRKENYRPVSLMNIDTKILNKILPNQCNNVLNATMYYNDHKQ